MDYRECQGGKYRVDKRKNFPVVSAQKFVRRDVVDLHRPKKILTCILSINVDNADELSNFRFYRYF